MEFLFLTFSCKGFFTRNLLSVPKPKTYVFFEYVGLIEDSLPELEGSITCTLQIKLPIISSQVVRSTSRISSSNEV